MWKDEEQGCAKCCQPGKLSHTDNDDDDCSNDFDFTAFSFFTHMLAHVHKNALSSMWFTVVYTGILFGGGSTIQRRGIWGR